MTLGIAMLSITAPSIMTLSITTLILLTFSIIRLTHPLKLIITMLSTKDCTQHDDTRHNVKLLDYVATKSLSYQVPLSWLSLCWKSWRHLFSFECVYFFSSIQVPLRNFCTTQKTILAAPFTIFLQNGTGYFSQKA